MECELVTSYAPKNDQKLKSGVDDRYCRQNSVTNITAE